MRLATIGLVITTAIISVSATLLIAAAPATQTDFEYKVTSAPAAELTPINQLGAQGWELVSVVNGDQGMSNYYLKRPTMR
jgi:hypothetical protein